MQAIGKQGKETRNKYFCYFVLSFGLEIFLHKLLVREVNKMLIGNSLKFSTSEQIASARIKTSEIQSINSENYVNKPNFSDISASSLYIIPTAFFTFWLMYLIVSSDILKFAKHKFSVIKHLKQVPCKNCRYFTNNPYLRCAVNPAVALTSEASNCSDYCPIKEVK